MSSALISTKVLPARLRLLFPFEHFNPVQSECFDITFNSDTTLVVASPTGSGKTGVLELALARMWASNNERTLALYVAPLKALVTERFNDWTKKTNELGLRVVALTGDDENDVANERAVAAADLILTTPEKWDSFTRFRRDAQGLLGRCGLLLLDEIHLLHERTRGPTLEAMVSRMLSISGHMKAQGHHIPISRIIGVSATIQNVHDIACWLSVNGTVASEARLFDASYRPVPLRWIVQSIPMKGVVFKYDATLCEHLHAVIRQYSDGRPTLVFCNSTKTAERAAGVVAQASRGELLAGRPAAMRTQLTQAARSIRNTHLASLLPSGTAFHVSTLVTEDRQTVEQLFLHGALPVLCCTSGLAQGLNLPARLVVIMNTSIYTPGTGGYEEYTRIEVLQAAGRAGRPQFDDVGVCVLMTRPETSSRYESLLSGSETIESHMDDKDSLTTHLNAEIAAGYLQTLEAATAWLKSTFLFVRMKRNPAQYNLPRGLSEAELEKRLSKICMRDLEKLAESEMIQLHEDGGLQTLPIGTVMARHYLDFKTAASFREIRSNYGIEELLDVISKAAEFQRALYLRTADKRPLFEINSKMVRFPVKETVADKKRKQPAAPDEAYGMQGEPPTTTRIARCKTTATKANLLLQLKAGGLPMQEFHYADWILSQNGKRILRALVDHLENVQMFNPLHKALLLQRSLSASVGWHDDPASGVRQLSGIGIVLLEKLREGLGGDVSLHTLSALHPARLEHICSKSHPWGQNTLQKVRSILASALSLSYRIESAGVSGEVRVTICAICGTGSGALNVQTKDKIDNIWFLVVGDASGKLLMHRKLRGSSLHQKGEIQLSVSVPMDTESPIVVHLTHSTQHGVDSVLQIPLPDSYRSANTPRQRATTSTTATSQAGKQPPKGRRIYNQRAIDLEQMNLHRAPVAAADSRSSAWKPDIRVEPLSSSSKQPALRAVEASQSVDMLNLSDSDEELQQRGRSQEGAGFYGQQSCRECRSVEGAFSSQQSHAHLSRTLPPESATPAKRAAVTTCSPAPPKLPPRPAASTSSFFDQFRCSQPAVSIESRLAEARSSTSSGVRAKTAKKGVAMEISSSRIQKKSVDDVLSGRRSRSTPGKWDLGDDSPNQKGGVVPTIVDQMFSKIQAHTSTPVRRLPVPHIAEDLGSSQYEPDTLQPERRRQQRSLMPSLAPAHTLLRHGGDHSSPAFPPVLSLSETRSFDRASVERLQGDSHVEPGRQAAPSVETPLSIQKESPSRPSPPTCDFFLGLEHPLLASIAHTSHKEQLARAGKARHLDFQEGESSPAARALSAPVIRNPLPKCGHSTEPRLEAGPSLARAMPTMSIARAGLAQGTGPDGEIHLCTAIDEWLSSAACGGNQKRKASPPAAAEPQRSMLHPPIPKPLTKTKAFSFLGQC